MSTRSMRETPSQPSSFGAMSELLVVSGLSRGSEVSVDSEAFCASSKFEKHGPSCGQATGE